MAFDHWLTEPTKVIPAVRTVMGTIDFDAASNDVAQHYVQASTYCVAPDCDIVSAQGTPEGTRLVDSLQQEWAGNTFCNPPYSKGNIDAFVDYGIGQYFYGISDQQIWLVNSATDCGWYHELLVNADMMCLWRGRIKFWKIFDGIAHEKWEGEESIKRRKEDPTLKPKIGNSPRFLNTLFYFGKNTDTFRGVFSQYGKVIQL